MHLKMAIRRRFMTYLRSFILMRSSHQIKLFSEDVLLSFWGKFHVYCWNTKLNFSKFEGTELSLFVDNTGLIKDFVEKTFIPTTEIKTFIKALCLLPEIFKFMKITYVPDMVAYESSLEQFESNLKLLYKYGDSTFLKDDDKPFYFHCMRYYLPNIARETFDKHKLGLGIFTM
jgi:hypothetical protein